jgi:hypothetical protein
MATVFTVEEFGQFDAESGLPGQGEFTKITASGTAATHSFGDGCKSFVIHVESGGDLRVNLNGAADASSVLVPAGTTYARHRPRGLSLSYIDA